MKSINLWVTTPCDLLIIITLWFQWLFKLRNGKNIQTYLIRFIIAFHWGITQILKNIYTLRLIMQFYSMLIFNKLCFFSAVSALCLYNIYYARFSHDLRSFCFYLIYAICYPHLKRYVLSLSYSVNCTQYLFHNC